MKVAITGASGYVGSCISAGFRSHGHEVLALSRRRCTGPWSPYALGDEPQQLPWDGVDVLVHAAYDFTPRTCPEIQEKNVRPSVALLQAAKQAGVGRSIFISSMSCFDGCRSNYGQAKLMIEKEVLELGTIVIRPGLVWGDRSGGVMGTLENLVAKLPIIPYLIGAQGLKQYLIHEKDLSDAIVAIAGTPLQADGTLHSVTHPLPVSLLEILKSIARRTHRGRVYLPVPWQLAMIGLKAIESIGIRPSFRSDSLTGLAHANPSIKMTSPPAGIQYRPFG